MFLINFLLYISSFLLAVSATNNYGKRYANNKYAKSASATQQLVIVKPESSTPLVANTTSTLLIESKVALKAVNSVIVRTTFICNGAEIFVESVLGVPTDYIVDSRLNGNCVVRAEAPYNSEQYLPSDPIVVTVLNPLYFEGTSETAFHTGEILPIYVRPADNAKLNINFVITCGSVVKTIPIVTTTSTINYVLTPDLVGDCTFTTTNVPTDYIPITPISVTISPSIFFLTPAQNTMYAPGSTITATLTATDGASNLSVTVELTCDNVLVDSKTQNIKSTYSFAPQAQIYGQCVLSLGDVNGYYTEETVTVSYRSLLSFVLPKSGSVIVPGTNYDIQVDGTSGTSSVSVTVVGRCQVGGSFTEIVPLGVKTQVTLGSGFQGTCTLTATTSSPYFTPATTTFQAYTPLTPAEKAEVARSLALTGRILDITKPYNKK